MEFGQVGEFLAKKNSFFHFPSIIEVKEALTEIIYSNDRGIYILYGDKGVGKSRLIQEITKEVKDDIYLFSTPPSSEREFFEEIYMRLRNKKFAQNVKIDEVRIRVNDAFKKIAHTIIIDNLLDKDFGFLQSIVQIRDVINGLKIIFIVDTNIFDSLNNISKDVNSILELPILSQNDIYNFLDNSLRNRGVDDEVDNLLDEINLIYSITHGNIQKVIDMVSTIFEILAVAHDENISKFKNINECIILMSAIDRDLIDG